MIKDFETVKKQLKELSDVINGFKSENVQLRIIELLFKGITVGNDFGDGQQETVQIPSGKTQRNVKRKKNTTSSADGKEEKKNTTPKGRPGPLSTLEGLVSSGFFKTKKTIGEVVNHCKVNLGQTYKSTDLSPALLKLVRDQKLKRAQNATSNQYEYTNS